jgi:hypothetical protein
MEKFRMSNKILKPAKDLIVGEKFNFNNGHCPSYVWVVDSIKKMSDFPTKRNQEIFGRLFTTWSILIFPTPAHTFIMRMKMIVFWRSSLSPTKVS